MSTSAPSSSNGMNIDPQFLQQCKRVLTTLDPHFDPARLNVIAQTVAIQTSLITNSSTSLEELQSRVETLGQICDQSLPPEGRRHLRAISREFELQKNEIIQRRQLDLEQTLDEEAGNELNNEITEAAALAIKIAQQKQKESCYTCGKSDLLQRCSRCKNVLYCSTTCQRTHWPRHKVICVPTTTS